MPFPILQFYVLFHINFLWLVYVPVCVNQWTSVVQDPVHSIPEPLNEWPLVTDIWERNIRQSFWNQIKKSYKLCLYKAIIAICKQSKTKKKPRETVEVTLPANLIRKTFSFVDVMEMMLDCVAAHFSIPSGKLWKPANMKHISRSRPSTNGSLQRPRQKRTTFCLVYKWQWKRYHNQGHLLARYLKEKKLHVLYFQLMNSQSKIR